MTFCMRGSLTCTPLRRNVQPPDGAMLLAGSAPSPFAPCTTRLPSFKCSSRTGSGCASVMVSIRGKLAATSAPPPPPPPTLPSQCLSSCTAPLCK